MTTETRAGVQTAQMIIGGQTVDAADGQTFDVVDPADGTVIATVPLGGREDVDRAVAAAQAAFEDRKGWASWAAGKRGRSLAKLAALIKDHSEELAQLESRNVGKPITAARGEIIGVSLVFDYYAGAANKIFGQTIPVSKPGLDLTLREPIGVVGLIVPWNFPLLMASWKVAPALAAGNTAILKPASYSPLTAIRLGELALEAGIPAGVLNIVTGPGGSAGASIAAHPGRRQGRLHRRDDDRPGDHAAGRGQREEDLARARRQEPEHRLRRRRPREVRPRVALLGLRQHRPGLLRPEPDPRRAVRPRRGRRAVREPPPATSRSAPRPRTRPRSARWSASSSATGSATTSRSVWARARRSSSVATLRPTRRWPRART